MTKSTATESQEKEKEKLKALNCVIVHIWLSSVAGKKANTLEWAIARGNKAKGSHAGHVSIQTRKYYASHWPDWSVGAEGSFFHAACNPDGNRTFEDDMEAEDDREPDRSVYFYCLDKGKIDNAIIALNDLSDPIKWTLLGNYFQHGGLARLAGGSSRMSSIASGFWGSIGSDLKGRCEEESDRIKIEGKHSCASAALMLLLIGGLGHLDPTGRKIEMMKKSIITPHTFVQFILAMKQHELDQYDYEEKGTFHNELPTKPKAGCFIL